MAKAIPKCPSCDTDNVVPIVYGYPDPETMESSERGELSLGGCCVTENDPEWHCKKCEHEWCRKMGSNRSFHFVLKLSPAPWSRS
jgi:hypothetical protein